MTCRKYAQQAICDRNVLDFLQAHNCAWLRVVDVSRGCGITLRAATMSLSRLYASKIYHVERSELVKKRNGKKYPVYRMTEYCTSEFPSWLIPSAPVFQKSQIQSIRGHYINDDN